jgi:DNA-binding GntR family transcriptional regulator
LIAKRSYAVRSKILARLKRLRPGTTMCPGRLARDCGTVLASIRAELKTLADENTIVITQSGTIVAPGNLKGPFRVHLKR